MGYDEDYEEECGNIFVCQYEQKTHVLYCREVGKPIVRALRCKLSVKVKTSLGEA